MKVLIVDDSKIVCNGLQQMLINIADVEIVGQAHNAQDAIQSISESKPDVVILDIRLPGLKRHRCFEGYQGEEIADPGHHADQLSLSPVPEKMRGTGSRLFF